jgi:hypothetical protein
LNKKNATNVCAAAKGATSQMTAAASVTFIRSDVDHLREPGCTIKIKRKKMHADMSGCGTRRQPSVHDAARGT